MYVIWLNFPIHCHEFVCPEYSFHLGSWACIVLMSLTLKLNEASSFSPYFSCFFYVYSFFLYGLKLLRICCSAITYLPGRFLPLDRPLEFCLKLRKKQDSTDSKALIRQCTEFKHTNQWSNMKKMSNMSRWLHVWTPSLRPSGRYHIVHRNMLVCAGAL